MRVSNPGYVVYTIYGTAVSQSLLNEFSLNSCVIINYLFEVYLLRVLNNPNL